MKKWLFNIELIYYALLPFLGYIAVYKLNDEAKDMVWLPLLGWTVLVVFQVVYLGILQENNKKQSTALLTIVPPFLIGLNHALLNGTIWNFFLEQAMIEVVALILGLSVIFLFFKNDKGRTAFQDLGIVIFLIVGLFVIGIWAIIGTWLSTQFYTTTADWWNLLIFGIAFSIELRNNIVVLNKMVKRKIIINDIYEQVGNYSDRIGGIILIGQILIWMILIPVLFR